MSDTHLDGEVGPKWLTTPINNVNDAVRFASLVGRSGILEVRDIRDANSPRLFSINFGMTFSGPPLVHIGITGFDMRGGGGGNRVSMRVNEVYSSNCVIEVGTWADCTVYWARIQWFAFGE
ncbi:hypothetical protein DRW03_33220 [Corallococcus sp. H22C18031201]|uniref:H-type lectin domain-containing protein n=1 Tax=Citreicoccus inhibens TaxID=2849499 RepID=UPI000E74D184|nr:H-type lectin domain-containing protein [Citreicoccus inhibens]MBU8898421.1 H-type lectin domain-containing protein [Citreicoccus inhibens]RJS15386.1 hypothetical protein DRW03_33220 [Corallococcus sp. H22C18031201]